MNLLPQGERKGDPNGWKFRLGLLAKRYPVQIALVVALLLVSYPVWLLVDAKNDLVAATEANRELALKTAAVALQANNLAREFQQQRINNIRSSCEAQNAKHDGAVKALTLGAAQDIRNAPDAAARKEIRRRRDVTIALLDALAEHRDCEADVRAATKPTATATPTPTPSPTPTP